MSVLLVAGLSRAQQPVPDDREPARPAPVPPPPPGPTAPAPAPPATEEEPAPPPEPEALTERQRVPEEVTPRPAPTFVGPDLFNPPAHQGWITITPSFTLSAEYNTNLFLSSRDRQSDVIFGLTPGVTLTMQRPNYRLAAGYYTGGQLFVDQNDLSGFGDEQRFFADYLYRVSPRVTFTLADWFVFGEETNILTSGGVSAGRQQSWRNTITPRLRWQATQSTGLTLTASHTILRFEESDQDSDTYRLGLDADRRFTPRLVGTLGADVAYIDIKDEPSAWTYTPHLGLAYDFTRTLWGWVRGGPSITERDGDTTLSPAVAAGLTQRFKFGSVGVGYDRAVVAESVGLSDRQAIFGSVIVSTLQRGFQLQFLPRYSIVDRDVSDRAAGDTNIETLTLSLRAVYQLARNISAIGSYTFYQQRADRRSGLDTDIDQNRVFFGLQYAYPISIY